MHIKHGGIVGFSLFFVACEPEQTDEDSTDEVGMDGTGEGTGSTTSSGDDTTASDTSFEDTGTDETDVESTDETGDTDFTADGCFKWTGQLSLADAVSEYPCVEVQPGTYVLDSGVFMLPGHTLRGVSAEQSVLRANPATWSFHCCDSIVSDSQPADPAANPFHVSDLTLDGAGVATYNVCCRGYEVQDTIMRNSRCSALGAVGTGVVARNNQMIDSAVHTNIEGRGLITCATGNFGGVDEGAAIYLEAKSNDLGAIFEYNTITGSYGPALDCNGAWGGVFRGNTVSGNAGWAAVSLFGASDWLVEDNQISHPSDEPPQPYHPYCAAGPMGAGPAAIFLCQDTDVDNVVTTNNIIRNNSASSFYGILSVGADEVQPYWAPRDNQFIDNDVFGSNYGCGDDFAPGQWFEDDNVWSGNNCAGLANTGPSYF